MGWSNQTGGDWTNNEDNAANPFLGHLPVK
jgi:hypothetical protein